MAMNPGFDDEPGRWRFCIVEHAGHSIALMAENRTAPELHMWEARPATSAPLTLAVAKEQWFPKR
jgi:hypothetical protein